MLNELTHCRQRYSSLIPQSPTVGRAAYTVIRLVTPPVELSTRYTTADMVLEIGSTNEYRRYTFHHGLYSVVHYASKKTRYIAS